MSARHDTAVRRYRLLLRAFPAEFRASYEREMTVVFRDQCRDADSLGLNFWMDVIWDVARSAPRLRVEAMRARRIEHFLAEEGTMKPMATAALVIGGIQIANALAEARAAYASSGGDASMSGVALGLAAAVMLIVAGIALLRRTPRATTWARLSAVACVAVIVFIRLTQPWMSYFGMLLGIGFPIVLLLVLQLSGRQGPSAPMRA